MVQLRDAAAELEIQLLGGLSGAAMCTLSAQKGWTVGRLKTEVANVEGTPVRHQCLMACGRLLDDTETLDVALAREEDSQAVSLLRNTEQKLVPDHQAVSLIRSSQQAVPASSSGAQTVAVLPCGSGFCVRWTVDGRRLRRNERQAVSPPFELNFGAQSIQLALVMHPKREVSFQKSKGTGCIDLKCIHAWPLSAPARMRCTVSVGKGSANRQVRGPFQHDFGSAALCLHSREQDDFDFVAAVDPESMTFPVVLEIECAPHGEP
mmetsp:Transcript_22084/g.69202  ORF Transcript_22084/g.69202 Transcript_22084/m.69202 type:complete len:264 (-) Transcript_22084:61-852(-)